MSLTDADSRKLQGAPGEHFLGYNVPVAVDAQHGLIAVAEVVPAANDRQQLAPLATAANAELHGATLAATAAQGCPQAEPLAAGAAAGITAYVPAPATTSGQTKADQAVFPKEQFRSDAAADTYHGPGGHTLPSQKQNRNHGQERGRYHNRAAGRDCPLRSQCTTGRCRVIGRHPPRPLHRCRSFHTVCEAGCCAGGESDSRFNGFGGGANRGSKKKNR